MGQLAKVAEWSPLPVENVPFSRLANQRIIFSTVGKKDDTIRPRKPRSSQRLLGYARVSTADQDLMLQIDALREQGCREELIFIDKASGARTERPGLESCLAALEEGDVLLVWRLDRLGRSLPHLVALVEQLRERGVSFRSVCDGAIDTTTASGELVFTIFSALAQFERRLIQERTKAGLAAARARGRKGGRKPITPNAPAVRLAKAMHKDKTMSVGEICGTLKTSRSTLYRYLAL